MLDPKVFLKLLQLDLQAHPPGAPVVKVSIAAQPAEPRRTQNELFQPSAPEAERLEVTLARIGAMIERGAEEPKNCQLPIADCRLKNETAGNRQSTIDNHPCSSDLRVGSVETLDTHRPDAFRIKRFAGPSAIGHRPSTATTVTALRLFRPPNAAQIVLRAGKPARIECESVRGEIAWAAGPWKASGEWWSEQPWAREEWDVCVGEACYRIYRDAKGWFVEGTYD